MERWHRERALMQRRQRDAHVILLGARDDHPEGRWRKRAPGDCGRARCGVCHSGKWDRRGRNAEKRAAIAFELDAEGGE